LCCNTQCKISLTHKLAIITHAPTPFIRPEIPDNGPVSDSRVSQGLRCCYLLEMGLLGMPGVSVSRGCDSRPGSRRGGVPPSFPPSVVVQVKALACELPHRLQLPLSRLSLSEIRREVITQGLVAEISGATLWRWLSADALRPWRHRSWIFPRDPDFAAKAGRILDLYDRLWQGAL
jgi:hypothetical protein